MLLVDGVTNRRAAELPPETQTQTTAQDGATPGTQSNTPLNAPVIAPVKLPTTAPLTKEQKEEAPPDPAKIRQKLDDYLKVLGPAVNYMPDVYGDFLEKEIAQYTNPEHQNVVRATVLEKRVFPGPGVNEDFDTKLGILKNGLKDAPPGLSKAIYDNPTLRQFLDTAVKEAYDKGGAVPAADRLRQLTEILPPDLAGKVIKASQPTIDQIIKDASFFSGRRIDPTQEKIPTEPPHSEDWNSASVLTDVSNDLARAVAVAADDPANDQIVRDVGKSVVAHFDKYTIGSFCEPILRDLKGGPDVDLLTSTIEALNSSGRTGEAQGLAMSILGTVTSLQRMLKNAVEDYGDAHTEDLFLKGGFSFLENPKNAEQAQRLKDFQAKYEKEHPDRKETQERLNQLGDRTLQLIETLGANKDVFAGMEPWIPERLGNLEKDINAITAMSLSEKAMNRVSQQLTTTGNAPIVAQLSADNIPREGRTFLQRMAMVFTGKNMDQAARFFDDAKKLEALATGADPAERANLMKQADYNYTQARDAVGRMKSYQNLFGYSGERRVTFDKMLKSFDDMIVAGRANDAPALRKAIGNYEAATADEMNGPTLHPTTWTGLGMRALGLALAYPIVKHQLGNFSAQDPAVQAQILLNSSMFAQQSLFILAGLGKLGVHGTGWALSHMGKVPNEAAFMQTLLGKEQGIARGITAISHTAEPIAISTALVEAGLAGMYLWPGEGQDVPMGLLHGANAAGSLSIALGYMKGTGRLALAALPASPVLVAGGTVVVLAASVGTYFYGKAAEGAKYENEWASGYLEALGFTKDVANQVRNNDGDGRSPGQVLAGVAASQGLDLTRPEHLDSFVKWMNDLGADKVAKIIEKAHGVDPDDKGEYQQTSGNDKYLSLPVDPTQAHQRKGSGVIYDPIDKRYEDPATQMYFDPENKRWTYYGPEKFTIDNPHPYWYVPGGPGYIMDNGGQRYIKEIEVNSIDGLRNWIVANGYGKPDVS